MKKVIFSRDVQPKRGFKKFVLREKHLEQDNITHVKKSFSYYVTRCPRNAPQQTEEPEVFIRKNADQRRRLEMVKFEVRGKIFTKHNNVMYEVVYNHVLNIHIRWNEKIVSPNNTALA